MPSWLATTISVLAGGILTMIAAWLNDRRVTERDRERRREERQERLKARRSDFQRETLLALQIASQGLLRNTGASLHQDIVEHRKSGIWQRQRLPEELSDGHLRLTTDVMLLASRVRDDKIRLIADDLRAQSSAIAFSRSEQEAESRMLAAAEAQKELISHIGMTVRDLDEED